MATPMNEDLWKDGIPPYVEDNSKGYREYVDRIAKRVDEWIKSGGGGGGGGSGDEPDWSWVKNDGNSYFHIDITNDFQKEMDFNVLLNGTIDWGDGSEIETVSSGTSSVEVTHQYNDIGKYVITISTGENGSFYPKNYLLKQLNVDNQSVQIANAFKKIEAHFTQDSLSTGYNGFFEDLPSLEMAYVSVGNLHYFVGPLFKNCTGLLYVKFASDIVLSNGGYTEGPFEGCTALKYVVMEDNCTMYVDLGTETAVLKAFNNCANLELLPENIVWRKLQGSNNSATMVSNSSRLKKLDVRNVAESLTTVSGWFASKLRGLLELHIGETIDTISANAFNTVWAENLYVYATTPPTLANTSTALVLSKMATIHVPEGTLEAYQGATNWADWADNIVDDIPVGGE